jgi:hypothetical protein
MHRALAADAVCQDFQVRVVRKAVFESAIRLWMPTAQLGRTVGGKGIWDVQYEG